MPHCTHLTAVVLTAALALTACPAESDPPQAFPSPSVTTIANCTVTLPRPAASPVPPGALFGERNAHGNDGLWVGALGDGGVIKAIPEPDGTLGVKLGWYRITKGSLAITGRRLDGPAEPLRSDVPHGYGDSGFQATGVFFPVPGCWEVTGTVGATTLTFVTLVIKTDRP